MAKSSGLYSTEVIVISLFLPQANGLIGSSAILAANILSEAEDICPSTYQRITMGRIFAISLSDEREAIGYGKEAVCETIFVIFLFSGSVKMG